MIFSMLLFLLNHTKPLIYKSIQYFLLLILFPLSTQLQSCTKDVKLEPTFPKGSIDEIAWSPDGSKIEYVKHGYWGSVEEGNR